MDEIEQTQAAVRAELPAPWLTLADYIRAECERQDKPPPPIDPAWEAFATPHGGGWLVQGQFGPATYQKFTAMKPNTEDWPDDPVAAARWMNAHAQANYGNPLQAAPDVTLEPPRVSDAEAEAIASAQSLFGEPAEAAYGGEDETHGETVPPSHDAEGQDHGDVEPVELEPLSGISSEYDDAVDDAGGVEGEVLDVTDADFTEPAPERDALDADLIPLRGIAWDENTVADEEAAASTEGPIAYAASDLDALVREKLGRVSQIARELKAALQDGWTIDEFRSLQNLIVRIDRGEATDDAQARARFVAISERSQAMSRVDAHRDALEAALDAIGKARDYQGAQDFDPEAGWPE